MIARLFIVIGIFIGLAFGTYWAYDASRLYVFQSGFTGSSTYGLLFESAVWAIPVAILLGVLVGSFTKMKEKPLVKNGRVLRHDESMFFQHWANALATLLLIGTGISLGFLFLPRLITGSENIGFALNLHFIGVCIFLFVIFLHVTKNIFSGEIKEHMPKTRDFSEAIAHYKAMFGFGKKPEEGKFLASERLSYPVWGIMLGGIILTGLIKVSAYIWNMPEGLMAVATFGHGLFTIGVVALLIVHIILSAVIPPSWPLIRSMITGYAKEDYVKKHHVKWYKELKENENIQVEQEVKKPRQKTNPIKDEIPTTHS